MEKTGNKGEWSEVYALFKLLADGELSSGDANLNKIETLIYPIISIIRDNVAYNRAESANIVIKSVSGELLETIPARDFEHQAETLLREIREESGAFEVPQIMEFRKKSFVESIKAPSGEKADIIIVVHDERTGTDPELGFSIKSQLGRPSTLLNASSATNFIYRLTTNFPEATIYEINNIHSQYARIAKIMQMGEKLKYAGIEPSKTKGSIFECNLVNIDSSLPEILALLLLNYYRYECQTVQGLTEILANENPLGFNMAYHHTYYETKIKRLLVHTALGMTPTSIWNGRYQANGGYLVIKSDGEIVCYHIYNKNEFEDYLFNNTKIDSPSRKRHDYGYIYHLDGCEYMKLNLQIRFIK